jgi:predicted lysophospholipase L1 biosynthesis ABC-type transport system permease subunit
MQTGSGQRITFACALLLSELEIVALAHALTLPVRSDTMNAWPFIWGLAGGVTVLALRGIYGYPVLPRLHQLALFLRQGRSQ